MMNKVEIINMVTHTQAVTAPGWSVKVERGDLRQNGTIYPSMVRRVTLLNLETKQELVQVFRGSSCADKADKWVRDTTSGAFGSSSETRWMWQ